MKDIMFLLHDGEKRRGGVETLLSQCQYQKGTNRPTATLKKWNENWGNKWTQSMCMNAVHTAAMIIGSFWYWFWVDDHQIDVDTCVQEIHGLTTKFSPNYMVHAFHFYFYQSSPFIQKELIKPWVSSELGAGPVYGRGGERTGELCSWQMAHNGGRQRTWIHFGWLWISQALTFNVE